MNNQRPSGNFNSMMPRKSYLLIILMTCYSGTYAQVSTLNYLFKPGDKGYACFRIPAVITTSKGTILAFAEARKNNCGDADDIDLVVRRSEDRGQSWLPLS